MTANTGVSWSVPTLDETVVGADVVDAVGDRLSDRVARKVVNVDQLRFALRLPFPPRVFEVADELLLLGVDGEHRDTALQAVLGHRVDVLELGVAIWVLRPFHGLVRRLQAVFVVLQQFRDGLVAHADAVPGEHLVGEHVRALCMSSGAATPDRRA